MKKVCIRKEVLAFVVDLSGIFLEIVRIGKGKEVPRQVVSKMQNNFDNVFLLINVYLPNYAFNISKFILSLYQGQICKQPK